MSTKKTAIATALFALGLTAAGTATSASLKDVIQQTLSSNPEISITTNERLSRDQEIRQAKSGYYPTVDLNAGYGWEWTDSPTTRDNPGDGDEDLTRKELSLELRQMLFDGFATRSEVARQTARTESAAHIVTETAEKTALRTAEVYLELLKQQELLALAEENLKAHKRIFDQIQRRSETGVSRKADLDQISGRVALAEANVIASKNNVLEAETNFLRVVGQKAEGLNRPTSPASALPANVEDAVTIAVQNHPTLKSAQSDIEAAQAQHEASKHAFYPRFDLELSRTWHENLDGVPGDNEDAQAMLRMRWNLFNGQGDTARKEQTAHLINEAKDIRDNAARQAEEGVRLSWASYQSTMSQRDFLKKHVDASMATRKAYTKQFDIGQRSLLDLLDTENEVFESSKAYLSADYTHQFAQYRILNGMGKLLDSFELSPPAEAQVAEQ